MRVVYPNAEYKVDNDICGYVHRYHEMTGSEVMEITMFQDIFEMIVNNVVDVDFSNKEQVVRTFEGLSYFESKLVDKFLTDLYDHIYKLETEQSRKDIEAFIEQNLDKVEYLRFLPYNTKFLDNTGLSEEFFSRHLDKISWQWLSINKGISEDFFERHIDRVVWGYLSKNEGLSEKFFERHLDKVEWRMLSRNKGLSEAFFERHLDEVNWYSLFKNDGLSEEFFERHLDKVNRECLSYNMRLSLDFHKLHLGKLNISYINLHKTVLNKMKRTEYYAL